MTLELEKFEKCAEEFLSLSSSVGDQWTMKNIDSREGGFYLEKRYTVHNAKNKSPENDYDSGVTLENVFSVIVYHIIYSSSYSVPVLYFNAYHENGKLLTLDEIWNKVPTCYQSRIETKKWETITQQEHPILGIPYFMIHPCYTADFMKDCSSSNYLLSWLSIVGPLAGINLSLEYAKCMQH